MTSAPPSPGALTPPNAADRDDAQLRGLVADATRAFARAFRAHQLYLPNNPMHARALDAARTAFATLWGVTDEVRLAVHETELFWEESPVLQEAERGAESVPWLLYQDGVRMIAMAPGFERADLVRLLDALRAARNRGADDDDLVTLLWECDFAHFTYEYVDLGGDGSDAPGAELLAPEVSGHPIALPQEHSAPPPSQSAFAGISEGDTSLFFLDEREAELLRQALTREFREDMRPAVVSALLDTFELERDPLIREEVLTCLESLVLALLSRGSLRLAAYAFRELDIAINRAAGVTDAQRQRVRALIDHASAPEVVQQLLMLLEEGSIASNAEDLVSFMSRVNGQALEPIMSHYVHSPSRELRTLLDGAIDRLAAASTGELARLVESDDESVSIEAIRRSGALRSPGAVTALARLLSAATPAQRRAAVTALGEIGTPGAMQLLERTLDDEDHAIRTAAVQLFALRGHRAAAPRIERAIREWVTRTGTSAERTTYLDAYAALAGEAAVPLLDNLLNRRDLLRRTEETSTRAAAAAALARVGSQDALSALGRASNDKDVVVRTAVTRALRGGTA